MYYLDIGLAGSLMNTGWFIKYKKTLYLLHRCDITIQKSSPVCFCIDGA